MAVSWLLTYMSTFAYVWTFVNRIRQQRFRVDTWPFWPPQPSLRVCQSSPKHAYSADESGVLQNAFTRRKVSPLCRQRTAGGGKSEGEEARRRLWASPVRGLRAPVPRHSGPGPDAWSSVNSGKSPCGVWVFGLLQSKPVLVEFSTKCISFINIGFISGQFYIQVNSANPMYTKQYPYFFSLVENDFDLIICPSMMLPPILLFQIDTWCKENNYVIAGYYQANERTKDSRYRQPTDTCCHAQTIDSNARSFRSSLWQAKPICRKSGC